MRNISAKRHSQNYCQNDQNDWEDLCYSDFTGWDTEINYRFVSIRYRFMWIKKHKHLDKITSPTEAKKFWINIQSEKRLDKVISRLYQVLLNDSMCIREREIWGQIGAGNTNRHLGGSMIRGTAGQMFQTSSCLKQLLEELWSTPRRPTCTFQQCPNSEKHCDEAIKPVRDTMPIDITHNTQESLRWKWDLEGLKDGAQPWHYLCTKAIK